MVRLLQVLSIFVYLGCVCAFLVVLIVLVLLAVFVMAQFKLTLLYFAVQVEVSVARSNLVLLQLVIEVDCFRFESRLLLFFFALFRLQDRFFNFLVFCSFRFLVVKVGNDVEIFFAKDILSVLFNGFLSYLLRSFSVLGCDFNINFGDLNWFLLN